METEGKWNMEEKKEMATEAEKRSEEEITKKRGNDFGLRQLRMGEMCIECGVRVRSILRRENGQGTTEYAILVGVLVLIAIVAVTAFKGRLQELWSSIADGINGL